MMETQKTPYVDPSKPSNAGQSDPAIQRCKNPVNHLKKRAFLAHKNL